MKSQYDLSGLTVQALHEHIDLNAPASYPYIGFNNILVMDDDPVIQAIFYNLLKLLGYNAICVREGAEALHVYEHACLTRHTFVAVILDLRNRIGAGGEATVVKLREINPHIQAIVSSGDSGHPVMRHFQKYGFVRALAKPFSIEELRHALLEVQNSLICHQ